MKSAAEKAKSAAQDAGVSSAQAQQAHDSVSSALSGAFHALLKGVGAGIEALASIAIFLSFMALSLFFLLKDGPLIRGWLERHMGVPPAVGRTITGRVLGSLRGYFVGVTAVAAFNAIVIGLGALDSRRPARRIDRGGQLRRRVHPVPRRVVGGSVHGADRARLAGHVRRR